MDRTRAIKARIKSVEGILQITKSMKMASAAKLRRVQKVAGQLEPFARESARLLAQVAAEESGGLPPLLQPRPESRSVCFVLIVGGRGLCGVYNSALVKLFEERLRRETRSCTAVICGAWGRDILEAAAPAGSRFLPAGDLPTAQEAGDLAACLKQMYLSGEADEIVVLYQRFDSFLKQTPCALTLLPAAPAAAEAGEVKRIYEPDRGTLLERLADMYVDNTVYSLLLEARRGEHAARMAAMTAAADNTDALIAELELELNHARQAAITTEISEIAGGAAALNKAGT